MISQLNIITQGNNLKYIPFGTVDIGLKEPIARSLQSEFFKDFEKGDVVIELGGHVGYLSAIFANLVGTTGKVIVLSPA